MLLAATGMRAVEALSIRIKDLDLQSNPPKLFVRGEFTKTRSDRTIFLTSKLRYQLLTWINYKYRSRRVCYSNNNSKILTEYRIPEKNETDLVFSVYQSIKNPNPNNLYVDFGTSFAKTLDRMGKGAREDGNNKRRRITLHSFRRHVKTTIFRSWISRLFRVFYWTFRFYILDKERIRKSRDISKDRTVFDFS